MVSKPQHDCFLDVMARTYLDVAVHEPEGVDEAAVFEI